MDPNTAGIVAGAGLAIATDAGKKLVGPLAEQLGLALGDFGDIYRFYQNENLGKIFIKWAEARGNKPPLTDDEIRRTLPLLPLAAVQCDDELRQKWAALLENTTSGKGSMFVSFGQTLSQLTADEARFLDRFLAHLIASAQPHHADPARVRMARDVVFKVYDPEFVQPYTQIPEKRAMLDHAELIIQDLDRLGILTEEQFPQTDGYVSIPSTIGNVRINNSIAGKKIALHRSELQFRTAYSLSPYGAGFIRAVSPAK